MPVSQFTIYSSGDPYGPGLIDGTTGSLVRVLDACLVDGYGTGSYFKAAAGWTKPFPNFSSSLDCYKQPSGSQMTLVVNDMRPNATALGKEAWMTGWELLSALTTSFATASVSSNSGSVGVGWGQFPLPVQVLTTGHVVVRKSTAATVAERLWVIAADAYTMYLWIQPGDTAGNYVHRGFGDIYSFRGSSDRWDCFIYGQIIENAAAAVANDYTDAIGGSQGAVTSTLSTALPGHYVARNAGGSGGSIGFTRKGDAGVGPASSQTGPQTCPLSGVLACPNGSDNSIYLSPLWLVEPNGITLRGRFRGLYQICHPVANFSDGQMFQGSGDFAGKSFMVIRTSFQGSMWALETSATIDTN